MVQWHVLWLQSQNFEYHGIRKKFMNTNNTIEMEHCFAHKQTELLIQCTTSDAFKIASIVVAVLI